ncbi:MAG: DegT/DnrJ/EryC1/StrS family aminotransferase [Armatimonadetes bacterium]|nr:DegT/DnrJ/EryC1/StrS family aminotransferase [Armatimonadota bacterium]
MPHVFGERDLELLREVVESGQLCSMSGKMTARFEKAFASRLNARHALACNSAMSGLHWAVAAAGVGPGAEVICDPIVHFAGFAAMYHNGVPVFADVDPRTHNMDPNSVRARVTPRTKAIICTHLWGLPCDMDPIMEIAREHNLVVIEDCAHALFATYKGRCTGTLGHIGVFSFQQSKHLATGDGGMIVTNDDRLLSAMRDGWKFGASAATLAWNYRMSELVAAVGLAQLARAEEYVAETVANARTYQAALEGCDWIVPQPVAADSTHVYHIWVPLYYGDRRGIPLERFKARAAEVGLACGFGYLQKPAYQHRVFLEPVAYGRGCPTGCPLYDGDRGYRPGACPNAEEILPRVMLFGTTVVPRESVEANAERLRQLVREFS